VPDATAGPPLRLYFRDEFDMVLLVVHDQDARGVKVFVTHGKITEVGNSHPKAILIDADFRVKFGFD